VQFSSRLEITRQLACVNRLQNGDAIMTIYGYARVSTDGQSLASQESELEAAGCTEVFAEKVSGARGDRAELAKALKRLECGDTLIITRLDRLARSTRDLLNILHTLSQNDVSFKSLHDVWADTTSAHGRLMLTVLGGLAEFERELILARTNDGRKRAKARGVRFGRPRKLTASAGARGYAPDPVFENGSKCARPPRNDSEKAVDSFCSAGPGPRRRRRSDSPAGFCSPAQR
jgi:DNA invertase Pin-like site-specific DNA recombinase